MSCTVCGYGKSTNHYAILASLHARFDPVGDPLTLSQASVPYHPKWARNWSIEFISRMCENGSIRVAIEKS